MKKVELLDCTLGLGGKLIGWNYSEKGIRDMQELLNQSRFDIVELGLLQSHAKGPQFSIYTTSLLPSAFSRRDHQQYAVWMGEDRVDLSTIPEHSEDTVDIIRVPVTERHIKNDLVYCKSLQKKGYSVAVMLEDTVQYSEKQLCVLLKTIDQIRPWACCIVDESGILTAPELQKILILYEKMLNTSIRIGFHGSDSRGIVLDLAKMICIQCNSHSVYIDVSAEGMGVGGSGLSAKDFAEWTNETFEKNIDIYILRYLAECVKHYLTLKESPIGRLAYHLAAENRCSYQYIDYYLSDLQLDVPILNDILKEIPMADALKYDKKVANYALRAFRKKRLNIIIIIPTSHRWEAVDTLLFSASRDLLRYGVDIEIYDSSSDDRTRAVVTNFQIDGYDNVFYKRYEGEFDGLSIDQKVISAFENHMDYDYIWVCRDGLIPRISDIYEQLIKCAAKKIDYIVVDAAFRNNMHFISRTYDNCLDFFADNSARTTILGSYIFRKEAIRSVIDHQPLDNSNYSMWLGIAPLQELAVHPFRTMLIVDNVFDYNPNGPKQSFWGKNTMEQWGRLWYNVVSGLPHIYDEGKPSALRIQMYDFHPFHLRQLLGMRGDGAYSLKVYWQFKQYLPYVSDTPKWKFYLAAVMPRMIARFLTSKEQSPIMQKILTAYRKI